ncbi:unnamed protein product [Effrenium voratum]|uniref:Uncharacterized protein n=1 Tax=Effrenium voratum TaxID=2562239 RepID=A0AA36IB64_9DINO|nr:unnamed protein product [Effrenium voratum]CAJ1442756.1 unnamed protein product [Effrenium voratum]CAJ1460968.1 unnamed protein product [Effrenium voratum]
MAQQMIGAEGMDGNEIMKPCTMPHSSMGTSTPFHWRFTRDSLWSGEAEAWKLASLTKSMLSKGYMKEETLCARDLEKTNSGLRFGDGQKRGLSSKLARLG